VLTVVLKYLNPAKVYRIHDWTLEKLHSCEMSLKESLKLKVWRFSRKKIWLKMLVWWWVNPECILVWCRGMPRAGSRGVGRSFFLDIENYQNSISFLSKILKILKNSNQKRLVIKFKNSVPRRMINIGLLGIFLQENVLNFIHLVCIRFRILQHPK